MDTIALTAEEIRRMEAGSPNLHEWGDFLLLPFEVFRLRHAKVLWINQRWINERGLNFNDEKFAARLNRWLIDTFAFAVPSPGDPDDAYLGETATFYADRYGSSSATAKHGGSGRAGITGCFQAKGIGITPLAGTGCDWIHSNGCASLEEALREVIFSEIFIEEFPYGATPVVAILDAGLSYEYQKPDSQERVRLRRAIVIRPAVLRPAHAERAPLFHESITGYLNNQADDVARCRDFMLHWSKHEIESGRICNVRKLVNRIATQIAFSEIHRLFSGGYFSSNMTLDGSLVDFGGARALPTWAYAIISHHAPGSGDGLAYLEGLVKSLVFYHGKYGKWSDPSISVESLMAGAFESYERTVNNECLRIWGLNGIESQSLCEAVICITRKYYATQQHTRVDYARGGNKTSWLYDQIEGGGDGGAEEKNVLGEIERVLLNHFCDYGRVGARLKHSMVTARRLLMPRYDLERERLQIRLYKIIDRLERNPLGVSISAIDGLIRCLVGRNRRHWPWLPSDLTVLCHVSMDGSSALLCSRVESSTLVLWLEGIKSDGKLRLFDQWIDKEDLIRFDLEFHSSRWNATFPIESSDYRREWPLLRTASKEIRIPKMQISYLT